MWAKYLISKPYGSNPNWSILLVEIIGFTQSCEDILTLELLGNLKSNSHQLKSLSHLLLVMKGRTIMTPIKKRKKIFPKLLKVHFSIVEIIHRILMEGKTDALGVSFLISLYSYSRIKHLLPWEIWEFLLAHYSEITSPQASKYSL